MKTLLPILLLSAVTGCVSVRSKVKSDAVPMFSRILVVTNMYYPPRDYEQRYLNVFPKEYQVCAIGVTPLTFNPDSLIREKARTCQSDVILTISMTQRAGTSYNQIGGVVQNSDTPALYFADMRSVTTDQPFWKAQLSAAPIQGRTFPPRTVVKRLMKDGVIDGKMASAEDRQRAMR